MKLRSTGVAANSSGLSDTAQPLAIVAIVIILGASVYLWRKGYLRGRAALITLAATLVALGYIAFVYTRFR